MLIAHCSSSSKNPVTWGEVLESLHAYWVRSPYESRIAKPSLKFYKNPKYYKANFVIRRKIPMMAVYKISRVLGTANFKDKMS